MKSTVALCLAGLISSSVGLVWLRSAHSEPLVEREISQKPVVQTYERGYQEAYPLGYRDGINFRKRNSGYNPNAAFKASSSSTNASYQRGFREGFFAGFEAGYYGREYDSIPLTPATPAKEPNQDTLSMTCTGTLPNKIRFNIFYTREAGFSRAVFAIPSGLSKVTTLTYKGKTYSRYGVWEGPLGESKVRVEHLSTAAPKKGDRLSVTFNKFSSRATCR